MYNSIEPTKTQHPFREQCKRLYQLGLSILPLRFGEKLAACKWKELQTTRLTPDEIKSWCNKRLASTDVDIPFNIGIITGKLSGVVVVDADDDAAVKYVNEHLPYTPIQVTSRKGCHFYYKYPSEGLVVVKNFQGGTLNGQKIDIRGEGGLTVGPGSVHQTGFVYQFSGDWAKWSEMPSYNPAWLTPDKPIRTVNPEAVATWVIDTDDDCDVDIDERLAAWRKLLSNSPGSRQGGAIKYTFALAMAGIHGCCLSVDEALPEFTRWGTKDSNQDSNGGYYPWTEAELLGKLEGAATKQPDKPRGWLLPISEDRLAAALGIHSSSAPTAPQQPSNTSFFEELAARKPVAAPAPGVSPAPAAPGAPIEAPIEAPAPKTANEKYERMAVAFVQHYATSAEHPLYTSGRMYFYERCRYVECDELPMKVREFFRLKKWSQSNNIIGNVCPIVQNYAWRDSSKYGELPFWIGDSCPFKNTKEVVAYTNGILDVSSPDNCRLQPHTPSWCSTYCLPYEFSASATCPLWESFLSQIFEDDNERINLLQEFFGYCLTQDTSLQKALLLIGKPRSGKGTIQRMLGALVGKNNSTGYSLDRLATEFGTSALVNKAVALVGEVELNSKDSRKIIEVLKDIIGEDETSVNQKHKEYRSMRLSTRFVIAANSVPRFLDASGALSSRLIFLPFEISFAGREDTALESKLLAELPGIANWALKGLRRLRGVGGRFTIGAKSAAMAQQYTADTSPVLAWVKDCVLVNEKANPGDLPSNCITTSSVSIAREAAYKSFTDWCTENNTDERPAVWFSRNLRDIIPKISDGAVTGKRVYKNIGLKTDCVGGEKQVKQVNSTVDPTFNLNNNLNKKEEKLQHTENLPALPAFDLPTTPLAIITGDELPDVPYERTVNNLVRFKLSPTQLTSLSANVRSSLIEENHNTYTLPIKFRR